MGLITKIGQMDCPPLPEGPFYGHHGNFVKLSESFGAKYRGNWKYFSEEREAQERSRESLKVACDKARKVHEAGISSPKVYGIFDLPIFSRGGIIKYLSNRLGFRKPIITPSMVMDYVDGVPLNTLSGTTRLEAKRQFSQEISKAREFGFGPGDHLWKWNSLWSQKDEKVILLDFDRWEMPEDK